MSIEFLSPGDKRRRAPVLEFLKQLERRTWTPVKRRIRSISHIWRPLKLKPPASYEAYKQAQNAGNLRKLNYVGAREANIAHLAREATDRIGPGLRVLCHGTRNGAEIKWFRKYLPDAAQVLGTEIADTATRFPDTIQWDFHDLKDEWIGAWDVIYSNSWDHAFAPERAFRNWMACLSPRGLMFLEHVRQHTPTHVTSLDPFGATLPELCKLLDRVGAPDHRVVGVLDNLPEPKERLRVVVVGRQ